jgi:hypothetical protein
MQTLVIAVTIDDSSLDFPVDVRDVVMGRIRPALAKYAEANAAIDMHWDVVGVMLEGVDSHEVVAADRYAEVTFDTNEMQVNTHGYAVGG